MTGEVNKLAEWMVRQGYATGHSDSMDDLLHELEWQFKEKMERSWEKGVVDGRQIQMQTSVDRAVNAMSRKWVELDEVEIVRCTCECVDDGTFNMDCALDFARAIEDRVRSKNI